MRCSTAQQQQTVLLHLVLLHFALLLHVLLLVLLLPLLLSLPLLLLLLLRFRFTDSCCGSPANNYQR